MSLNRKLIIFTTGLILIIILAFTWSVLAAPLAPATNLSSADTIFQGEGPNERAGTAVAALGDINGDGFPDFAIGAPLNSQVTYTSGKVYIFFGHADGFPPVMDLSLADASFVGERLQSLAGASIAGVGDVNNDGYADFLIGAPKDSESAIGAGQVYLILGKPTNQWGKDVSLAQANASFWGESATDNAGMSVAGVGDLNGDGFDDFIIGAPLNDYGASNAGQIYIIKGKATGWTMDTPLANADGFYNGEKPNMQAGYSVAGAGDVDGDGIPDILTGAWLSSTSFPNAGEAFLILGKDILWGTRNPISAVNATFVGEHLGFWAGISVAGAGDVNNDGYDDILVGANGNDDRGRQTGEAYLILGGNPFPYGQHTLLSTVDASFRAEWEDSWTGQTVSPAGDLNKDGYADFMISAVRADDGGVDSGVVFLVLGQASGWTQDMNLIQPIASFVGQNAVDYAGTSLAALGDINGDGWDDLLVGAPQNDNNGTDAGAAYLLLGNNKPAAGGVTVDSPYHAGDTYHTITASYNDMVDGFADIKMAQLYLIGNGYEVVARYRKIGSAQNLYLRENGGAFLGPCTPGIPGELVGTLYKLDCGTTTVSNDGAAQLQIAWRLNLIQPVTESYTIEISQEVTDNANQTSGIQPAGTWTIDPNSHDHDLSAAPNSFLGEFGKDNAGWSIASGDVNGDGLGDFVVGAPNYSTDFFNGGRVYLFFGKPGGWGPDLSLADADVIFNAESDYDYAGYSVALTDVNNDGKDDILIGAYSNNDAGTTAGKAYLILARETWPTIISLTDSDASFLGEDGSDFAGYAVVGAGDVNGDGFNDILIGAWGKGIPDGNLAGATYLIFGKAGGWTQNMSLSLADASFLGEAVDNWSGYSIAGIGDVNADGYDDILIGAPGNEDNGADAGKAYLILGKALGWAMNTSLVDADASFTGMSSYDRAGMSVAGIGDVNADGYADFLIGAPGGDASGLPESGQAYLFLGTAELWGKDTPLTSANSSYLGEKAHDMAGRSLSALGDLNSDGYPEFAIAAPANDDGGRDTGKIYILHGQPGGWQTGVSLSTATSAYWGENPGDRAGYALAGIFNSSGDNLYTLLTGAPGNDQGGEFDAGKVYNLPVEASPLPTIAPWPMFNHDAHRTGLSDYLGPQHPDLLWSFTTGGAVRSSPAIGVDGTIYVGSDDGSLYALNPDGTLQWQYPTGSAIASSPTIGPDGSIYFGSDGKKIYRLNPNGSLKWSYLTQGQISSSPILGSDGTVYVGSDDNKLYALHSDGSLKWAFPTGGAVRSSPTIGSDGTIFVGSLDTYLYAIKPDGTKKWSYKGAEGMKTPVSIDYDIASREIVYIGGADGRYYALYAANGAEKWKFYTDGSVTPALSIAPDGSFYAGCDGSKFYRFDAETGEPLWEYFTGDIVRSSAAIGPDKLIYVGVNDGKLYVFDEQGSLVWQYQTGGALESSPAIGKTGTVYIGSDDGSVYAIGKPGVYLSPLTQSTTGLPGSRLTYELWLYNLTGSDNTFDINVNANWPIQLNPASGIALSQGERTLITINVDIPVLAVQKEQDNATIQVTTRGQSFTSSAALASQVSAIIPTWPMFGHDMQQNNRTVFPGAQQAVERWKYPTGGDILSSPAVGMDGTTYFGSIDNNLYAVNVDGKLKWSYQSGGMIRSSPALGTDGTIYFGSMDHKLHAINPDGTFKWSYTTSNDIASSPTIGFDGTIYIGSGDGKVYAITTQGALLWSFGTGSPILSSPRLAVDGTLYIGSTSGIFYAIKLGELAWSYVSGASIESSPAIASDGTIYFGSNDYFLYALHPDGSLAWKVLTEGIINSSPAIGSDGLIYVGAKGIVTFLYAYHPDGSLAWRYPHLTCTPLDSVSITGPTSGIPGIELDLTANSLPPTIVNPITYTWEATGQTTIVHVGGVTDLVNYTWQSAGDKLVSVTAANDCSSVSDNHSIQINPKIYFPVITRNKDFSSTSSTSLDLNSIPQAERIQSTDNPPPNPRVHLDPQASVFTPSPIIAGDGKVYMPLDDGFLHAFSSTGEHLWKQTIGALLSSSPAIGSTGEILIGSGDGNLYSTGLSKSVFTPTNQLFWNLPGSSLTYTLTVQNLTGPADRFSLSVTGNNWITSLSINKTPLLSTGQTSTFTVEVNVPINGLPSEKDTATIVATSESFPAEIVTATINSMVTLGAGPWAMFHHDISHSGRSTFIGPQTNKLSWSFQAYPRIYSSAAIATDGTIFFGAQDGYIHALNPDGSEKWAQWLAGYVDSSPAVNPGDGTVYIGSDDHNLYALDPINGSIKWAFKVGDRIRSSAMVGEDSTIYFGCDDGKLYAVTPTGELIWSYQTGDRVRSTPAIGSDGSLYFGSEDSNIYALNSNGTLKWTHPTGGRVDSSAAIDANGIIYIGSEDHNLYALNPADGSLAWAQPFDAGDVVYSTPAIATDGTIYFGAHNGLAGKIYALYPNGTIRWTYASSNWVRSSPAIGADGTIYIGSWDNSIYAFNPNGSLKWSYPTGLRIEASPVIGADGRLYIGSADGYFYVFGQ